MTDAVANFAGGFATGCAFSIVLRVVIERVREWRLRRVYEQRYYGRSQRPWK